MQPDTHQTASTPQHAKARSSRVAMCGHTALAMPQLACANQPAVPRSNTEPYNTAHLRPRDPANSPSASADPRSHAHSHIPPTTTRSDKQSTIVHMRTYMATLRVAHVRRRSRTSRHRSSCLHATHHILNTTTTTRIHPHQRAQTESDDLVKSYIITCNRKRLHFCVAGKSHHIRASGEHPPGRHVPRHVSASSGHRYRSVPRLRRTTTACVCYGCSRDASTTGVATPKTRNIAPTRRITRDQTP